MRIYILTLVLYIPTLPWMQSGATEERFSTKVLVDMAPVEEVKKENVAWQRFIEIV